MSEIQKIIIIYLTSINVATFITYGIDKLKAKRSNLSTIGFAVGFVLMMVLDVVLAPRACI